MSEFAWDDPVALTETLLRVESVIGEEEGLANRVEAELSGLRPHALIRAENSLCVVPRAPRDGAATLMLVGHLDTVPRFGDNPVRIEGDRLHGLGASDMKAADAVMLTAVHQAMTEPPRHDLVVVLYSREEGPFVESEMPAIRDAARSWFDRADLAICMEPTDGNLHMGALGTCHARFSFGGQRAHSARPWQGDNAIHKAHGLLARLEGLEREEHVYHGLPFYEVLSATGITFRGARNVVPDLCEVNVNYRFAPGKDEAAVRARLDELAAGVTFELTDFCPAGKVCGDNPLLIELRDRLGDVEVQAKQAWTDVGRLSQWDIDAVNWGPGATAQAHQAGEWVSVDAIRQSAAALRGWLFGN